MSRIDELIAELCPDGVEFKALGEVCNSLKKGTLKTGELSENGKYPVINSGREWYGRYDAYNNDGNAISIAARGEYAGFLSYIGEKFWAGGLCYPYRSKNELIASTKYIYYALKRQEHFIMNTLVARGSIPALNKSDMDAFKIPIPPLEVQREIVKVLDTFTQLEAELEARRQAVRALPQPPAQLQGGHMSTMPSFCAERSGVAESTSVHGPCDFAQGDYTGGGHG